MTQKRKLAYFALIIAAFIWGIATPVIKYTLNFISVTAFLYFRFLIASLIVAIPLCKRIIKIKPTKKEWFIYIFLGFLCTPLNLYLLFIGLEKTTSIDASLISITAPFLVAVGGALFLKENVNNKEKLGIGIAIFGTLVTIAQPLFENVGMVGSHIQGNLLVLLGTLVWVAFTLIAKKYRHLDPFILSSTSFLVGLATFMPLFLIAESKNLTTYYLLPATNAIPGILFIAIFSSVVAYSAHIYGLTKIEASEAEVFTYLQPLFAVPISAVFLHEKITLPFLTGAILIAIGVYISSFTHKNIV